MDDERITGGQLIRAFLPDIDLQDHLDQDDSTGTLLSGRTLSKPCANLARCIDRAAAAAALFATGHCWIATLCVVVPTPGNVFDHYCGIYDGGNLVSSRGRKSLPT